MSVVLEKPPINENRKEWADWFFKVWLILSGQTGSSSTYTPTSRTLTAGDGLDGGGDLSADRTFSVDSTVVRTTRQVIAGDGLTGGGTLDNDVQLNVSGGFGIIVDDDEISVDPSIIVAVDDTVHPFLLMGG